MGRDSETGRIAPLLITIDGPAGAGKTTVSRFLADRLGFLYVDTGALYRAVAFETLSRRIDPENEQDVGGLATRLDIGFEYSDKGFRLISDGVDISDAIRTPEITMLASAVSAMPVVREALFAVQKRLGARKSAVFEGRDMGTVVFPEADVKFFLTAALETRAMRRFSEYGAAGGPNFGEVLSEMRKRDENDSTRAIAPLRPAGDAIVLDSTDMPPEAVVERMVAHVVAHHGVS